MKPFLTAYWSNLLMVNYEVPPELLKPYLPAGTELDFLNGKCYVSLVGFMFLNTKLKGIAFPFHQNFEEVNLRFYVRFNDGKEWKRGVVFVKEIVPRWAISSIANLFYGEKYQCMSMKNSLLETANVLEVKYQWKNEGEWNCLQATVDAQTTHAMGGSLEEFITEHYWGYARLGASRTTEYEVRHPKWQLHKVLSYEVKCNIAKLYGNEFVEDFSKQPASVLLAKGSAVQVGHRKVWNY